MKWNLDYEEKTYDTFYALDSFVGYWTESEALIKKAADEEEKKSGPKWKPKDEEEAGEYFMERDMARHLHDEIVTPMFRYSCIAVLYTVIERELRRIVENLEKESGQQKLKLNDIRAASFLGQVTKFIEVFYGPHLTDCPQYQALCDLQKIRHCIIHCRGEVSLSQDKAYLVSLKERRPGFFAWEHADIEIEAKCIEQFIAETLNFFIWLFGKLNWKIDDYWKEKKWVLKEQEAKVKQ